MQGSLPQNVEGGDLPGPTHMGVGIPVSLGGSESPALGST